MRIKTIQGLKNKQELYVFCENDSPQAASWKNSERLEQLIITFLYGR